MQQKLCAKTLTLVPLCLSLSSVRVLSNLLSSLSFIGPRKESLELSVTTGTSIFQISG